jgi:hypothetical protein
MSIPNSRLDWRALLGCAFLGLFCTAFAGCGASGAPSAAEGDSAAESKSGILPVLAISGKSTKPEVDDDDDDDPDDPDDDMDDNDTIDVPKAGTAEWYVHEGTALMLKPPPKTEDVEALKKYRRERNDKVITLSQKAMQLAGKDKSKERVFNLAVHNLLEARSQSALAGDSKSVDALYQDAAALAKRAPDSQAAAEGAHALVNLAYNMAKASTTDSLRWIGEFAVQAQRFAEDFRQDERRSLPLLFTAGRSCELADMTKEALDCYTLIVKGFPASPFAAQVAPIIKRLKLPGNPPQLDGPTLDGDHLSVDDLLGKVVLVVFWSTEVRPFVDQLPRLSAETRKQARRGLYVIGVNLDIDSSVVAPFLAKHKISWPQIVFPETEKRGWNNPLIVNYGIMDIPAMWLIDQSGNVISTNVKLENLAAEVDKLLGESTTREGGAAKYPPKPEEPSSRESILERPGQLQKKKAAAAPSK